MDSVSFVKGEKSNFLIKSETKECPMKLLCPVVGPSFCLKKCLM